jgi:hypothetical protein
MQRVPRMLTPLARALLAYNNLLGFPYRNGFTPDSLERLVRAAGFDHVTIHRSALVSQHDEQTRRWAKLEEDLLKATLRIARANWLTPWFELYARNG